jgi:hypothetical protein
MSEELFDWIKRVSLLTDEALREEIQQIHQSSVRAFTRALSKIPRPAQTHTLQNDQLQPHPHADTINLLKAIGEQAIASINAETPVSPLPFDVNPLMDLNTRIKVLTRRITVHLSEIPRGKVSTPIHLQIRQFIGQDLAALEDCFETQQEFSAYTLHHFKWNLSMCLIYICYYRFMVDYPMFVYSGLSWTRIRNDCVKWRRWLDSVEAKALSTTDYTSSSFWKGALPPYRERYEEESDISSHSFHSLESNGEQLHQQDSTTQMVISESLNQLNLT